MLDLEDANGMSRNVCNLLPTYTAHIPVEGIPQLHCGGTLKSHVKRETSAKYESVEKLRSDRITRDKFLATLPELMSFFQHLLMDVCVCVCVCVCVIL